MFQAEQRLQLLHDGRSVWVVWGFTDGSGAVARPDDIALSMLSSDSERTVLSWGSGCTATCLGSGGGGADADGCQHDSPDQRVLVIECPTVRPHGEARSPTSGGGTAEPPEGEGEGEGDKAEAARLQITVTFETTAECETWQRTLQKVTEALQGDDFIKLEMFMQHCGALVGSVPLKQLKTAAEEKFGPVFMALHKDCFLRLYQDMAQTNAPMTPMPDTPYGDVGESLVLRK